MKVAFLDLTYTKFFESYAINSSKYGGWNSIVSYAKEMPNFYVIAAPESFSEITDIENKNNLISINEQQRNWIKLGNPIKNVVPNAETFDIILTPHISQYFNFQGLKAKNLGIDLGVYQSPHPNYQYLLLYSKEQFTEIKNKDVKIFYFQLGVPIEKTFNFTNKEDYIFSCSRICPLMASIEISVFCRQNNIKAYFAGPIYEDYPFLETIDNINTFYLGEISNIDKINYIRKARLCSCIIQWASPFSLFMLESLSNGTPIVAINSSNFVRNLIKPGINGFFAHNNNELLDAYHKSKDLDPINCYKSSLRYNHLNMLSTFFDALQQTYECN